MLVKMNYSASECINLNCCFLTTKLALKEHKRLAKAAFKLNKNIAANDSSQELLVHYNNYPEYLHCLSYKEISPAEASELATLLEIPIEGSLVDGLEYNTTSVVGFNLLIDPEDVIEDQEDDE